MATRSIAKKRAVRTAPDERDRLLEQSLSLVCAVGFDGYMKRINPTISAALGYTLAEIAQAPLVDLVHPDERDWAGRMMEVFTAGQSVHGVELRVRAKDGTYKWVLWDAVPCVDEQLILATGQDITARKAIEEELRESQERFQLIAGATDLAVWDWDLRADRVWRNEAYCRTYGVPDDRRDGTIEWWRKRVHPDDIERVLTELPPPIVDGRQQWSLKYRWRRLDGTYAHVYDRGFVIFGGDGNPVRMVGSVLDISNVVQAEAELREGEERFRLAAKATRDAIWDWDIRNGRVWRSDGFGTFFGYAPEWMTNELEWWIERTHPDDRQRVMSTVRDTIAKGLQQCSCEYRFRRADGRYADVIERGFVMYDPDGKAVRMVGSLMDITDRRRAEETASMQQAELARIARVRTMGEIATGLAHELNQPLAAIANYAESCVQALGAQSPPDKDKLLGWIEKIAANTHRAGEIIRSLRAFSRKSEPHRSSACVDELVREVIELVEPETRRRNMRVQWNPLPAAQVTVDGVQIQQVLVNLLHNAYDAAARLPPERRLVTIEARPLVDAIELSVTDLGRGIAADHRDRVFDAFFSTKAGGVGTGLAISRSIVEDHGGRLWLSPNPRHGVTFHFTLPTSEVSHGRVADRSGSR